MAEIAGLIIGGIGLAALFDSCMQALEYVNAATDYGTQCQRLMLRLSLLHLRLSRWGATVHIVESGPDNLSSCSLLVASQAEAETIRELLGEIFGLLKGAREAATRYKLGSQNEDDHMNTSNSANINALVEATRFIASSRQKQATALQKARWALHDEKKLRRLVEDLTSLITDLVELFPASHSAQQALASIDAAVLMSPSDVAENSRDQVLAREGLLRENTSVVDPLLAGAVAEVATVDRRHALIYALTVEDARMHNGDFVSEGASVVGYGHDYHGVLASGRSRVLNGNRYGGKSVLDD
ncbi:hypothetical protein LTS10_001466 [Elasticomyces elasticus]|nr:hypothetical protein LTS10_001466 [Elasticomyces elasticus]